LGFEDVESAAEPDMAQVFDELLPEDIAESRRIALRYVRFQSVTSLHVRSSQVFKNYFNVFTL
jgi:hypothetical protein